MQKGSRNKRALSLTAGRPRVQLTVRLHSNTSQLTGTPGTAGRCSQQHHPGPTTHRRLQVGKISQTHAETTSQKLAIMDETAARPAHGECPRLDGWWIQEGDKDLSGHPSLLPGATCARSAAAAQLASAVASHCSSVDGCRARGPLTGPGRLPPCPQRRPSYPPHPLPTPPGGHHLVCPALLAPPVLLPRPGPHRDIATACRCTCCAPPSSSSRRGIVACASHPPPARRKGPRLRLPRAAPLPQTCRRPCPRAQRAPISSPATPRPYSGHFGCSGVGMRPVGALNLTDKGGGLGLRNLDLHRRQEGAPLPQPHAHTLVQLQEDFIMSVPIVVACGVSFLSGAAQPPRCAVPTTRPGLALHAPCGRTRRAWHSEGHCARGSKQRHQPHRGLHGDAGTSC